MIIWFTGQPGSGKTTLAKGLQAKAKIGEPSGEWWLIDGDELREVQPEGFDVRGRFNNVSRAQDIALYLHNRGENVVVALVSPNRAQREWLKEKVGRLMLEFYLHTDELRGREHFFSEHYEQPEKDYQSIDTGMKTSAECLDTVVASIMGLH